MDTDREAAGFERVPSDGRIRTAGLDTSPAEPAARDWPGAPDGRDYPPGSLRV